MIDDETTALLHQHRSLALNRFRWFWQADPNDYLDNIDYFAGLLCDGNAVSALNLSDGINQAHQQLTSNLDLGFDGAARDLEAWTGSAADNFNSYLLKVKQAIGRYSDVLHDLRQIQAGYEALVDECVRNVRALLNKAIQAQEDQQSQEGWSVTLTAIAAVSAGIGAVVSGPVGWAIVTSAVAGAASEGSVIISTGGPGETAQSLRDGLWALLSDVLDQRDRFYAAVAELDDVVTEYVGNKNLPEVEPPPPSIITAPSFDPASFDLPSDIEPPGIENGVSRDPLVPRSAAQPNTAISNRLAG